MNLYPDEAILSDIIAQTAEFRFRICWDGTRSLLRSRGIDPMRCLLLSCDQGDDTNGLLMLPNGQLVNFNVRKDHSTRRHNRLSNWTLVDYCDREYDIARAVVTSDDAAAFDAKVLEYFNDTWGDRDAQLPPIHRI